MSPSTQVHSTKEIDVALYVSIGVSGAVVVLIVAVVIVIVCLWMKISESKPATNSFKSEDMKDYISITDENIICTSPNEAYTTIENIHASRNPAYGMVHH